MGMDDSCMQCQSNLKEVNGLFELLGYLGIYAVSNKFEIIILIILII